EGSADDSVQKPTEGAFTTAQARADNAVQKNLREVAEFLDRAGRRWQPDVVVLAGEVQGRSVLRDELPVALQEIMVETDRGGLGDDGAEESLLEEVHRIAGERARDNREDVRGRFEHGTTHDLAIDGAANVARAAEMGAIDTLVLSTTSEARRESELIAAAAATGAGVGLVSQEIADGVGAILRFEAPDELKV
ncbi:MAG: hypothetical protein Q4G40_07975, partial [Brachybacterium sp.]|nr:hypothetical protein [Brachybacterium sp.]